METALIAAGVFPALWVAHRLGDHIIQTQRQADLKGLPINNENGWAGPRACAAHVLGLTLTKVLVLSLWAAVIGLPISPWAAAAALTIDAASHYWADRRTTLLKLWDLAGKVIDGKGRFARAGDPKAAPLGVPAYVLDQDWHYLWLLITTALIAVWS
jgi:hypothetical protein